MKRFQIPLGTVYGIPVKIHPSFFLLLLWVGNSAASEPGADLSSVAKQLAILCVVFGCVVLHEFGHIFTAARFGIPTRDVVLYPFGGVAALRAEPRAAAELWVALAGPAVNIGIAILLSGFIDFEHLMNSDSITFLESIFVANVFLPIFNLIPAFPMDGGRVLRALLTLGRVRRPTVLAATLGVLLSALMFCGAVYLDAAVLMLVSAFICMTAFQERRRALLLEPRIALEVQGA